jgi:hypothetical protein
MPVPNAENPQACLQPDMPVRADPGLMAAYFTEAMPVAMLATHQTLV